MSTIARFREKLRQGRTCVGTGITFTDPLVTDALGDSVDFFWIDLEHCAMSPEALAGHLLAARARQVPALVRVAAGTTTHIKAVLDAGADGVIVPQVRSVDEVQQVVGDCRYPPLGRRGYGPRVPSNYGRDGGRDYIGRANLGIFVALQIETREALAAIDDIIRVPGLDSLVVGPWDLSGALGMLGEVTHPTVFEAISTIAHKARQAGLAVGAGMGTDPEYACRMAELGIQWLQVGNDYGYLVAHMDQITASIRYHINQSGGNMPLDPQ